jgi:hypothetical protein
VHYRIYLLTSENSIWSASDVDCADDAEAFAAIPGVIADFPAAELWCGVRRVGKWFAVGADIGQGFLEIGASLA